MNVLSANNMERTYSWARVSVVFYTLIKFSFIYITFDTIKPVARFHLSSVWALKTIQCDWYKVARPYWKHSRGSWALQPIADVELKVFIRSLPDVLEKKNQPQINTFDFKIVMLQKDVQTLTGCCLSPVIIFCSASSTSVPTQKCCPAERMSRLKGLLQP